MNRRTIPTFIGIVFLVVGVATGVLLVQQRQIFRLGASGDLAPIDVRATNVTDTSFTVSWTTDRETVGFVNWGENSSLGTLARQEDSTPKFIHSVILRELTPNTNYFFTINSGGSDFDNSGIPWTVQTGPTLAPQNESLIISGTVLLQSGQPAPNVLIYATMGNISKLSAVTSSNGTWVMPLSAARSVTLNDYAAINKDSTLIELFIQAGPDGVATAQTFASKSSPTPPITLGQSYDFRDETIISPDSPLDANLNFPEDEISNSDSPGFEIDTTTETSSSKPVTLESIDEDGEVIYTDSPEFFGTGPAGENITITIESEPQTDEVAVSANGSWNWTPPNNLESGSHTITILWRDAQGFLRSITREFVVEAAEGEPAFQSTPSGTLTPSPTVSPTASPKPSPSPTTSPTIKPTPSPSPTLSPTPTPTDRVSIPSTDSGMPIAGSLTPTLVLVTMGIGLLGIGIFISKNALT